MRRALTTVFLLVIQCLIAAIEKKIKYGLSDVGKIGHAPVVKMQSDTFILGTK